MLKHFTLFTCLLAFSLQGIAQSPFALCEPATDFGTTDGDYIASIDFEGVNLFTGGAGSDFLNYGAGLVNCTIGNTIYIDVTNSADINAENIQIWIDLNASGTLDEPGELMDSHEFTLINQTTSLQVTIPIGTTPKTTAGRIVMHYIDSENSPCDFLTYGQIFDFPVSINSDPASYCVPEFNRGPLDGDFLDHFEGVSTSYYGSMFSAAYELYNDYENAIIGNQLLFSCISGDYAADNYYLFVDDNFSGFGSEDLKDSYSSTTANEAFDLSYNIPASSSPGVYRARIICRFSSSNEPCPTGLGFGHTVDFYIIYNDVDASPYCNPVSEQGTSDGDFISELTITDSPIYSSQGTPGPYYSYAEDSYPFYALAEKNNAGYVISGSYTGTDNYKVWIDYNQNNTFDTAEQMVAVESNGAFDQVDFTWTNPAYTNEGNSRMRVMCHFTDNMSDPCDASDFGEVEDYPVVLVKSNDTYCDPYFGSGNADGDFINNFALNEVNLTGIGAFATSFYKDYTWQTAQVLAGETYTITVQSGDYPSDTYKIWIDWNDDGTFDNLTEAVGSEITATAAFQDMVFTLTVPNNATLGNKRLRLVCADDVDLIPCHEDNYGEYLEITVAVVTEIGLPQLTENQITLFPNPGTDHMTIQYSGESTVLNASIYNATGQLIDSFQINQIYTLNHNYAPGYYTLKLSNESSEIHKVFIVE